MAYRAPPRAHSALVPPGTRRGEQRTPPPSWAGRSSSRPIVLADSGSASDDDSDDSGEDHTSPLRQPQAQLSSRSSRPPSHGGATPALRWPLLTKAPPLPPKPPCASSSPLRSQQPAARPQAPDKPPSPDSNSEYQGARTRLPRKTHSVPPDPRSWSQYSNASAPSQRRETANGAANGAARPLVDTDADADADADADEDDDDPDGIYSAWPRTSRAEVVLPVRADVPKGHASASSVKRPKIQIRAASPSSSQALRDPPFPNPHSPSGIGALEDGSMTEFEQRQRSHAAQPHLQTASSHNKVGGSRPEGTHLWQVDQTQEQQGIGALLQRLTALEDKANASASGETRAQQPSSAQQSGNHFVNALLQRISDLEAGFEAKESAFGNAPAQHQPSLRPGQELSAVEVLSQRVSTLGARARAMPNESTSGTAPARHQPSVQQGQEPSLYAHSRRVSALESKDSASDNARQTQLNAEFNSIEAIKNLQLSLEQLYSRNEERCNTLEAGIDWGFRGVALGIEHFYNTFKFGAEEIATRIDAIKQFQEKTLEPFFQGIDEWILAKLRVLAGLLRDSFKQDVIPKFMTEIQRCKDMVNGELFDPRGSRLGLDRRSLEQCIQWLVSFPALYIDLRQLLLQRLAGNSPSNDEEIHHRIQEVEKAINAESQRHATDGPAPTRLQHLARLHSEMKELITMAATDAETLDTKFQDILQLLNTFVPTSQQSELAQELRPFFAEFKRELIQELGRLNCQVEMSPTGITKVGDKVLERLEQRHPGLCDRHRNGYTQPLNAAMRSAVDTVIGSDATNATPGCDDDVYGSDPAERVVKELRWNRNYMKTRLPPMLKQHMEQLDRAAQHRFSGLAEEIRAKLGDAISEAQRRGASDIPGTEQLLNELQQGRAERASLLDRLTAALDAAPATSAQYDTKPATAVAQGQIRQMYQEQQREIDQRDAEIQRLKSSIGTAGQQPPTPHAQTTAARLKDEMTATANELSKLHSTVANLVQYPKAAEILARCLREQQKSYDRLVQVSNAHRACLVRQRDWYEFWIGKSDEPDWTTAAVVAEMHGLLEQVQDTLMLDLGEEEDVWMGGDEENVAMGDERG